MLGLLPASVPSEAVVVLVVAVAAKDVGRAFEVEPVFLAVAFAAAAFVAAALLPE